MEFCNPRVVAAFAKGCAQLTEACNTASDGFVALKRALDQMLRDAEDALTDEQRLRYYELRDRGVYPFDAIQQVNGDFNTGRAVRDTFSEW